MSRKGSGPNSKGERFFYVDETNDPTTEIHGIGILEVDVEIPSSMIRTALHRLEKEILDSRQPESRAAGIAKKTIENGYFHATDDGDLALKCFNEAIGKKIRGEAHLFLLGLSDEMKAAAEKEEWGAVDKRFNLMTSGLIDLIKSKSSPATIVFEERTKLTQTTAPRILDKLEGMLEVYISEVERGLHPPPGGRDSLLWDASRHAPAHSPTRTIKVQKKIDRVPGLQVIDHILWTRQRKAKGGRASRLFDNICSPQWSSIGSEGVFLEPYAVGHPP